MDKARTTVAVLAAGLSRRFGASKLDQDCAGRPLGAWAALAADRAGFARRILVVGPEKPSFCDMLGGWELVTNQAPENGLPGSVACAARSACGSERLVLALADMPLISAEHLTMLRDGETILFTAYPDGRRGVPAAFPASALERLAAMSGSAANVDWKQATATLAPASTEMLRDVDTPADLAAVAALLRERRG